MSKCTCGREIDDEEEVCGICRMGNIYDSNYYIQEQYRDYGAYGKEQFELDFEKY